MPLILFIGGCLPGGAATSAYRAEIAAHEDTGLDLELTSEDDSFEVSCTLRYRASVKRDCNAPTPRGGWLVEIGSPSGLIRVVGDDNVRAQFGIKNGDDSSAVGFGTSDCVVSGDMPGPSGSVHCPDGLLWYYDDQPTPPFFDPPMEAASREGSFSIDVDWTCDEWRVADEGGGLQCRVI